MTFAAIVVAGGSGERAGAGVAKQWRLLAGKPVIRWSVEGLLRSAARQTVVVVPRGCAAMAAEALTGLSGWVLAEGGATRSQSTLAGLRTLVQDPQAIVLVHDAARPFVTARHVRPLIEALEHADGATPALPVSDTLKRRGSDDTVLTASREGLWRAQTPQAFRLGPFLSALAAWPADEEATDELAVIERAGGRIAFTPGDPMLFKLTWPEDFDMAERLAQTPPVTRIGQGFDAHRFGSGRNVWLCGVEIPHDRALVGHSDADAALHALTDALLGAIGEGDIGDHFPPGDPRWKDAPSETFLRHAGQLIAARGGRIGNVDVTIICEAPRIGPHRQAMRAKVAGILGLDIARVSVKATTTEAMGFTGRGEGLAAQAVAAVELPPS